MLHSRMKRVGHTIRNEIGEIIQTEIKDPRLGFVTVQHVEVSKDLQQAIVFVSVLSDDPEEIAATLDALDRARGYIRGVLGRRVVLKFLPSLKFRLHEGAKHAVKVDELLKKIEQGRPIADEELEEP